ncbi:unnamed protein product, partial [Laminaria digitata]
GLRCSDQRNDNFGVTIRLGAPSSTGRITLRPCRTTPLYCNSDTNLYHPPYHAVTIYISLTVKYRAHCCILWPSKGPLYFGPSKGPLYFGSQIGSCYRHFLTPIFPSEVPRGLKPL